MIFQKKRILLLSCWLCLFLFWAFPGNIYAQYENAWMNVGSLHNWYSEIGSEVEHGWVGSQQYGLRSMALHITNQSTALQPMENAIIITMQHAPAV